MFRKPRHEVYKSVDTPEAASESDDKVPLSRLVKMTTPAPKILEIPLELMNQPQVWAGITKIVH